MPVNTLNELVDGELANATPLNENFATLKDAVNAVETLANTTNARLLTNNPVYITSDTGNLQLTGQTNSFVAGGTEALTVISGWTKGIAIVRWATTRTITHNATTLILQDNQNRSVVAGDISFFEFTADGARELLFFPKISEKDVISLGTVIANFTLTIDRMHTASITTSCTLSLPSGSSSKYRYCLLDFSLASSISLTLPTVGTYFKWKYGLVPTLVTTTGVRNQLFFESFDGGTTWIGSYVQIGA